MATVDMMEPIVDILRKARGLVVEKGWTQGAAARDHGDRVVDTNDPAAVCYCAFGALLAASHLSGHDAACFIEGRLLPPNSMAGALRPIAQFNDTPGRTKEEILALFDRAIAAIEPTS